MPAVATVLAQTLRDAGVTHLFGLPGGEVLDFMEAARLAGLRFLLTRHEASAALMADVFGQIRRSPGVCVSTLGPGAMNLTLGVANAFLDRSPLIAITASTARAASPYATHQNLDLEAVFRPFTKLTMTLDGVATAAKVRHAIDVSLAPRMGPVHIALPSDVARIDDRATPWRPNDDSLSRAKIERTGSSELDSLLGEVRRARRPVLILGLDLNPCTDAPAVRAFVDRMNVPVFVTPKAKGMLPEDHPLFCGVCAGVAGDLAILDFFARADLLIGVGFDPVESDKLWHQTMPLVSIGPMSIASGDYRPRAEVVGDLAQLLSDVARALDPRFDWRPDELDAFRRELLDVLRPASPPARGVSAFEVTVRLRELFPDDTVLVTDVGSVKLLTTQAWRSRRPLTFLESNGLSAMGYGLPAAMAARLAWPDRPVLCIIGDGGLSMVVGEIETCVRERLGLIVVVFNDSALSLIDVAQQRRGYETNGVRYGAIDFAAVAAGLGAWSCRVRTMTDLEDAVRNAKRADTVAVIDVIIDPEEYLAHVSPPRRGV
jgi:acetolactate synthase-1/2/3 large subunit